MTDGDGREVTNGHDPADTPVEPSIGDLLDDLAAEFPDVDRRTSSAGTDYVVGAHAFAQLHGRTAEFRLRPEIVAAAAKTGDATTSDLGRDWVTFTPRTFDQYALDRAQAWFELAHRIATEAGRSRN